MDKNVAEAYNRDPEREWHRLAKDPYHSLEFLVTMHYVRKHLPACGKILDAGGGPGRYTLELCRMGYDVALLDISTECISLAKDKFNSEPESVRNKVPGYFVGDIRDLSIFEDDHFDAVLCLGGPLTHINVEAERVSAVFELVRVAKSGAPVYISVMGYLAVLRTILLRFSHELLEPSFKILISRGDTIGSTGSMWHFFRADELRELAESCGLTTLEMAGCEGLSTGLHDATNLVGTDESKWERWVEIVLRTSSDPAVVDMAEHILYIGSKHGNNHRGNINLDTAKT